MRDFSNINRYLDELSQDIYSQPEDDGHTEMIRDVFSKWTWMLAAESVLDVGCGAEQVAKKFFDELQVEYTGISLGEENQIQMDMSFLDFEDESFELIWCRHVLEHSPMPLLTLMEFHRVSSGSLCLIMPNPSHFTFTGRNHYYVAERHQIAWLLRRAGWQIVEMEFTSEEFRFMCVKQPRISYEGYVSAPLDAKVYQFERDGLVDDQIIDTEQAMKDMESENLAETG